MSTSVESTAVARFSGELRKDSERRTLAERGVTFTTHSRSRDGYRERNDYVKFEFDRPSGFADKPHLTVIVDRCIPYETPRKEFAVGKFTAEAVHVIDIEAEADMHAEESHYELRFSGEGMPQFTMTTDSTLFSRIYGGWNPEPVEEHPLSSARLTLGALISEFGEKLAGPLASEERAKIEKMNVVCAELLLSLLY